MTSPNGRRRTAINRQTAIVRCFGSRDKKRHKRVVNVVVAMTRKKSGIRWTQAMIAKFVRNRNQAYIRSRRVKWVLVAATQLADKPRVPVKCVVMDEVPA